MAEPRFRIAQTGPDRRKSPRHEDCFYVQMIADGCEETELGELADISLGGMAVRTSADTRIVEGSSLRVAFPLGRSLSRVETRADIVGISHKGEQPTIHIQFIDQSPLFRETIHGCIRAWKSRPLTDQPPTS